MADQDDAKSPNPAVQGLFNAFKVKKEQAEPAPADVDSQKQASLDAIKRRMGSYGSS